MEKFKSFMSLDGKKVIMVDTPLGHMELLEYMLQDGSFVHVLQWHFYKTLRDIDNDTLLPQVYCETFYRDEDAALKKAHEIGTNLLVTFLI